MADFSSPVLKCSRVSERERLFINIQDSSGTKHKEMSLTQMRTTFGDEKVDMWLESGKLISRPDRVTGSTKPEHLEYLVPTTYTDAKDRSTDGLEGTRHKDDLSKEDIENIEGLRVNLLQPGSAAGSSGDGQQPDAGDGGDGEKPRAGGGSRAKPGGGKAGDEGEVEVKKEPVDADAAKVKAFLADPSSPLESLQKAANICKMLFSQVGI